MFNYVTSTYAQGGQGGNAPLGGMGSPPNHYYQDTVTNTAVAPGGGGGGGNKAEFTDKKDKFPGSNGAPGRIIIWY